MTPWIALAVPVGIVLGVGLWTLVALVPRVGAPRLSTRIAPYVAAVSPEARDLATCRPAVPVSVIGELLRPGAAGLLGGLSGVLGGDEAIERRLRQAGWTTPVARFRSRQLVGLAIGSAVGAALVAGLVRATAIPLVAAVAVGIAAAAVGLLAPEQLLARAARARLRRMTHEYPTIVELLTLSLAAGEGVLEALRRVARVGSGELARELTVVVTEVNAGVPLAEALTRRAAAIGLPPFTRTVDQLVAALDRGSPLVDVLRAEAQDARDEAKRGLLEAAGRNEVAMMVPLVFGILPVTVLIAIWPGVLVLRMGF
ncbi:type II secretion system F family protein [Pseudolysinimonas kribbensis]|uniref:type II secretion system F family protein n=1 Tax=Pseudolysinimonas kribbensis TaxID=433641 RepID=UPI0031D6E0EB